MAAGRAAMPGVAACIGGAVVALGIHQVLVTMGVDVPWLTLAVLVGLVLGQTPLAAHPRLVPGTKVAGRTLMRAGIVLLGLQIVLADVVALGPVLIAAVVALVGLAFAITWTLAWLAGMSADQRVLMAAGFSICGASAVGAVAQARGASERDQATPVALVTLCGTAAIGVLPLLRVPLGLDEAAFGVWTGASVHDVGQVVATAAIAGPGALALAVVVKLVRVVCLAPMTALVAARRRRTSEGAGARPPLVPLFVVGFLVAVAVRALVPLPQPVLDVAAFAQQLLLASALVGLLSRVRLLDLVRQDWRGVLVAVGASTCIAALALALLLLR
ncbi:putative sulfate exporter family transporter [Agrococcus versicolor]|uniref:Sulfate exporter family transporter n=1 Tax=Agrococcus versicolor TaxID=501482 RepID=A0ABN3AL26_9MICO